MLPIRLPGTLYPAGINFNNLTELRVDRHIVANQPLQKASFELIINQVPTLGTPKKIFTLLGFDVYAVGGQDLPGVVKIELASPGILESVQSFANKLFYHLNSLPFARDLQLSVTSTGLVGVINDYDPIANSELIQLGDVGALFSLSILPAISPKILNGFVSFGSKNWPSSLALAPDNFYYSDTLSYENYKIGLPATQGPQVLPVTKIDVFGFAKVDDVEFNTRVSSFPDAFILPMVADSLDADYIHEYFPACPSENVWWLNETGHEQTVSVSQRAWSTLCIQQCPRQSSTNKSVVIISKAFSNGVEVSTTNHVVQSNKEPQILHYPISNYIFSNPIVNFATFQAFFYDTSNSLVPYSQILQVTYVKGCVTCKHQIVFFGRKCNWESFLVEKSSGFLLSQTRTEVTKQIKNVEKNTSLDIKSIPDTLGLVSNVQEVYKTKVFVNTNSDHTICLLQALLYSPAVYLVDSDILGNPVYRRINILTNSVNVIDKNKFSNFDLEFKFADSPTYVDVFQG